MLNDRGSTAHVARLFGAPVVLVIDAQRMATSAAAVALGCRDFDKDHGSVAAFAASLPKRPKIVNLEPSSVADIFSGIERVAAAIGQVDRGQTLVASLAQRVDRVRSRVAKATTRPRCCHLEWIDPLFCSGHWTPELTEIAGAADPLGRKGLPSIRIAWERLLEAQPEILVVACCGYVAARAVPDLEILKRQPGWNTLPAVSRRQVYAVDGSAYFSRPAPRIVDGLEMLAQIVHPDLFPIRSAAWIPAERAATA